MVIDEILAYNEQFVQENKLPIIGHAPRKRMAVVTCMDCRLVQMFEQALKYYPDFEDAHLGLAAAFIAQQKMQDALPHLKKAIALNPDNEVSWYRLSQVQMALGSQAERQKAFAEFQRLRTEKSSQQEAARELFSRSEVTKQKLDSTAPQ